MKQSISKITAVFVLFLLIQVCSCTNTPWHREQAEIFLNKGIALIQVKQYNSAAKELLEAEKYNPDDPRIYYFLGMAFHRKGMKDKAIEHFKKAISLKEDYSEAHNYLGTLYSDMALWDRAIEEFDKALDNPIYDTPSKALYNAGWAYYAKKDYKTALIKYQDALRIEPMTYLRPQIEKNIGLIFYDKNNIYEAIEHFEKSTKLNPSLYDAQFMLGECYLKINNPEKARLAFDSVIQLSPQSSPFSQQAKNYLQSIK